MVVCRLRFLLPPGGTPRFLMLLQMLVCCDRTCRTQIELLCMQTKHFSIVHKLPRLASPPFFLSPCPVMIAVTFISSHHACIRQRQCLNSGSAAFQKPASEGHLRHTTAALLAPARHTRIPARQLNWWHPMTKRQDIHLRNIAFLYM